MVKTKFFICIVIVLLTQVVKFPDSEELVFRSPTLGWINPAQGAEQSLKNMSTHMGSSITVWGGYYVLVYNNVFIKANVQCYTIVIA